MSKISLSFDTLASWYQHTCEVRWCFFVCVSKQLFVEMDYHFNVLIYTHRPERFLLYNSLLNSKMTQSLMVTGPCVIFTCLSVMFLDSALYTGSKSHYRPGNHHAIHLSKCPFPGHNHLLTTGTDGPSLADARAINQSVGSSAPVVSKWL